MVSKVELHALSNALEHNREALQHVLDCISSSHSNAAMKSLLSFSQSQSIGNVGAQAYGFACRADLLSRLYPTLQLTITEMLRDMGE